MVLTLLHYALLTHSPLMVGGEMVALLPEDHPGQSELK